VNESEVWKDIEGYEGLYQVSNSGRIKSVKNNIIRKPRIARGYLYVNLSKSGKKKTYKIHRLVAQHFIPNPNNYPCVNHKDEDKLNNFLNNLEWCTFKYNTNYGTSLKRRVETQTRSIFQYDLNGELIKIWHGLKEISKTGMSASSISQCCNKKYYTSYGSVWRYEGNEF
jgi:hypothetical protein